MTDGISRLQGRAGDLARRLRCDLSPATDLWPRIAARIESDASPRPGRLPRVIEAGRDLWPGIRARIEPGDRLDGTNREVTPRGTGLAAAAGVVAVTTLTLVFAMRLGDVRLPGEVTASADSSAGAATVALPTWMADTFARFGEAVAGTPAAELGDTARSIQRDFLMVRAERLQIEQALAASVGDMNLRAQWRHVYLAELRLIDETEKLANAYGTRTEI
ncbi:MAG TPA: hypothetical protein VMR74_13995 [Gammaproteobacteria bacterium]|nr:hypothetical protein [Gammaproteobacteria bacterium]